MKEINTVETYVSASDISGDWKRLEDACVVSGYQTRRWVEPWLRVIGRAQGLDPLFILGRDDVGSPAILFPLTLGPNKRVRVASYAGGRDSNINMPLVRPDVRLDAASLRRLLEEGARLAGVDAFTLYNQPAEWRGAAHPMRPLPGQASPSLFHSTLLASDGPGFIESLSREARKRLRWRIRKLEELGPVRLLRATTRAEVTSVAEAFRQQKKIRIEAMGVAAEFNVDLAAEFFVDAALAEEPGVELYALMVGERVAAMYGGVVHDGAYHAMVNSYDAAPEIARASPGDVITIHLLQALRDRGLATFDLGVGEADYKDRWCERAEPLFDTMLGITAKGKAFAMAQTAKQRAKRMVKQSDWLWPLAQKARAALRRNG